MKPLCHFKDTCPAYFCSVTFEMGEAEMAAAGAKTGQQLDIVDSPMIPSWIRGQSNMAN